MEFHLYLITMKHSMKIPIVLVYNGTYCSVASNNVMFDVVY